MSYRESELRCDWCNGGMDNGDSVACKSCHEGLEQKVQDLEKELATAKERISELEHDLDEERHD